MSAPSSLSTLRGESCDRSIASIQRGFTLVELLVGSAVALIVVATTSTAVVGSMRADRALLLESRLMQDLRTAADVISRDLRRAGYWGASASGVRIGGQAAAARNPYADSTTPTSVADHVDFRFSRDAVENGIVDSSEQFGYRLRTGSLEFQLGSGNWQALTDVDTLVVDRFEVTPSVIDIDLTALCEAPCSAVDAACPPHRQLRSFDVLMTAHAAADAKVQRSLQSRVRVRNDAIVGACPA